MRLLLLAVSFLDSESRDACRNDCIICEEAKSAERKRRKEDKEAQKEADQHKKDVRCFLRNSIPALLSNPLVMPHKNRKNSFLALGYKKIFKFYHSSIAWC